jgi:hypothetical protein
MKKDQSFFNRLATAHRRLLRRLRLSLSMLAVGYLFFYIVVRPGRGFFNMLAGVAVLTLGAYVFEDFRRYLYLSGRRSAHSLSDKLLS